MSDASSVPVDIAYAMPGARTHDKVWFAEQIGKSPDWVVRNLVVAKIPHVRIGRSLRFTEADVLAFLEANRVNPNALERTPRSQAAKRSRRGAA